MNDKKVTIRSIIHKILAEANKTTDTLLIQKLFIENVEASNIKEEDKRRMIETMKKQNTYKKVVTYMYNSLLKYEGEGIVK